MSKTVDGLTWIDNLIITNVTPNAPLYTDFDGVICSSLALTDGQLLIGVTNGAPVASSLAAGNNMVITSAPGNMTIAMVAQPTFSGVTISGAHGIASFSSAGLLQDSTILNLNGCNLSYSASGVITASMVQDISISASPTWFGATFLGTTAFAPVYMSSGKH